MDHIKNIDPIIKQYEEERERLISEIEDLQNQVKAINILIRKRRYRAEEARSGEKVNRKNADRLLNEGIIIQLLKESGSGLRTGEIHNLLQAVGYRMKYPTVRSYVVRMRDKGLIYRKQGAYYWLASESGGHERDS